MKKSDAEFTKAGVGEGSVGDALTEHSGKLNALKALRSDPEYERICAELKQMREDAKSKYGYDTKKLEDVIFELCSMQHKCVTDYNVPRHEYDFKKGLK